MASLNPPVCDFDLSAIDFNLPDTAGELWTLDKAKGKNGLLVMFICNHCPYVKAIINRIVRDTNELKTMGVNTVAIMSNDATEYPEDSSVNMKKLATEFDFSFPYLLDQDQSIAKAYGAVCTPDFFGYNEDLKLQYRGRLDASRKETAEGEVKRDLFEAMKEVAKTAKGPQEQISSIGCSIKWL